MILRHTTDGPRGREAGVSEIGQTRAGIRWVCHCSSPPILLAMYDETGRIEVKVGDRYYIAQGRIQASCPRCGTWHTLEIRRSA
jgi:hypothetical protein